MTDDIQIERCPETGICSLLRGELKVDLEKRGLARISRVSAYSR
jgi:hypothetical protein